MTKKVEILVRTDDKDCLPKYMSEGAAGADVRASNIEPIDLKPGEMEIIPTGLFFEIPHGYEIQVRPRSGLAAKSMVTVLNSPGTIDSDYRGELKLIMINHSKVDTFTVTKGLRMGQIVVAAVVQAEFKLYEGELATTARGESRFGSSGLQ
ncbi:MAG: dUTP diphosphatase [Rhabdochlamydiaceae bacterium]|nr:dUTP diphosphatase [Candidatus Amphrikana amoebophyrae]